MSGHYGPVGLSRGRTLLRIGSRMLLLAIAVALVERDAAMRVEASRGFIASQLHAAARIRDGEAPVARSRRRVDYYHGWRFDQLRDGDAWLGGRS